MELRRAVQGSPSSWALDFQPRRITVDPLIRARSLELRVTTTVPLSSDEGRLWRTTWTPFPSAHVRGGAEEGRDRVGDEWGPRSPSWEWTKGKVSPGGRDTLSVCREGRRRIPFLPVSSVDVGCHPRLFCLVTSMFYNTFSGDFYLETSVWFPRSLCREVVPSNRTTQPSTLWT